MALLQVEANCLVQKMLHNVNSMYATF